MFCRNSNREKETKSRSLKGSLHFSKDLNRAGFTPVDLREAKVRRQGGFCLVFLENKESRGAECIWTRVLLLENEVALGTGVGAVRAGACGTEEGF